ncbi:MAG: YraN family protein [Nitriliruptorales bacterium]|nr:YraN family protein [Nitriliruptorales bacterium]
MVTTQRSGARQDLGRLGEELAAEHLLDAGWEIVARNWRSPDPLIRGELDLVGMDPDDRALVFVEVKTRRSATAFGGPLAAVTRTKQLKLRQLGISFLRESGINAPSIRFDVIGIVVAPAPSEPAIEHIRGAC